MPAVAKRIRREQRTQLYPKRDLLLHGDKLGGIFAEREPPCACQALFDSTIRGRALGSERKQVNRQSKQGKEATTGSSERKSDRSRRSLRRLLEERHSR